MIDKLSRRAETRFSSADWSNQLRGYGARAKIADSVGIDATSDHVHATRELIKTAKLVMRTRDAKKGETRSTSGFVKEIARNPTIASDKRLSALRRRDQKLSNYREKQRYRNRRENRVREEALKKVVREVACFPRVSFPSQNNRTLAREEEVVGWCFLVHVSLVAVANTVAKLLALRCHHGVVMDATARTVSRWIDGSTGRFDQPHLSWLPPAAE